MNQRGGVCVLVVLAGSFLLAQAAGRPTVYVANPYIGVGPARLDVTRPVEEQIPAGWRHGVEQDPYRLVKFAGPVGSRERARLAAAGYDVVAYHPWNSFLVRARTDRPAADPRSIEGVLWTGPFHPWFKIGEDLAQALAAKDAARFAVAESGWGLRFNVRFHEGGADPQVEAAVASAPGAVRMLPTRGQPLRVEVDPQRFAAFLQAVAALPEVVAIEPWLPRTPHNDENVQIGQSGNCDNNGVEAPNTTVFSHGITGWDARLVVADTCTDSNEGWWYDDALQRLPAHEPDEPWNSVPPDWAQRKLIEYYDMWSADTTIGCANADDHGTHVTGTVAGNCSLDAEGIATATDAANSDGDQDGMAPGAKLIAQDLGAGSLAYLNADGGNLGELYRVAFENTCLDADCGVDAHNNSWGADINTYDFDAESGDDALWDLRRGVIVTSAGNIGPSYNTIGTPATGKNVIAVGNASNCSSDVLAGGSSRGRTSDGRLKPDVVAGGSNVTSANNDGNGSTNANGGCSGDNTFSGTSMSSPTVAGYAGLVLQYFTDGFHPSGAASAFDRIEPSGPLVKAMLINAAERMTEPTTAERNGVTWPNMDQGWGFVVLDNALYFSGDARKLWVHDETVGVDVSGTSSMTFQRKVTSSAEPLKVTLVWYDTAHVGACGGGNPCLDNDLDLTVTEPAGEDTWSTTLVPGAAGHVVPRTVVAGPPVGVGQTNVDNGPDDLNSVEQIIIYNPTPDRVYSFTVTASNTPSGPIPFALVATGALADPCTAPSGASNAVAADTDSCVDGGVQVSWNQDVAAWNDGGTGTRSYRVIRDGMPIASGGCAGTLPYGVTSCVDPTGPDEYAADYRVEYRSGCGATVKTAETAATDAVGFFVDVEPGHSEACPGDAILFTAAVDPAGSYSYQWTEDGVDLPGQTASTLSVTKGAPQSRAYNCRVTELGSCANVDPSPGVGSWIDDPADVAFDPASVPELTLVKLCGDSDTAVEPGEIWSLDVGVKNRSLCTAASAVTADLVVNAGSVVDAEICNPHGAFGDVAPQDQATDGFAFEVDQGGTCPGNVLFDVANVAWSGGTGPSDLAAFSVPLGGGCQVATTCSCAGIVLGEVSPAGAAIPLTVSRSGSLVDLTFARLTGATHYNVYVSTDPSTLPFHVASASVGKKSCQVPWNSQLGGKGVILGYDVEAGIGPASGVYYILITADRGAATEGPLGVTSAGADRTADAHCAD